VLGAIPPDNPHTQLAESARRGIRVTVLGILLSALLAAVKIIAGVTGYSYALIADGIESMLDIMSSLVVLGSLRIAATPPNERYPFGYGKAEPLGAMVVASGLLVAATVIAIQSVREILTPHHSPAPFTLAVLLAVVATKEGMFRLLLRTGTEIGSKALATDAWHQRSDALTSLAAFTGITIALAGGEGYEAADDWAALFACGIIAYNGLRFLRSALRDVMDAAPNPKVESRLREISLGVDGVASIDKCHVRRSGLGYFVEIHVEVDGSISVRRGHEIAHRVKDALLASELAVLDVIAHVEPAPARRAEPPRQADSASPSR